MYAIENEFLKITAAARGAELQSVTAADGTEFLWQGDPDVWGGRAPNLFPYVGRLTQKTYEAGGKPYEMEIHGLAPYLDFSPQRLSAEEMEFTLQNSLQTLPHYPFHFAFRVNYRLQKNCLHITYKVENRGEKPLYFGLGGHPGFNVPLYEGARFCDYRLRFETPCSPLRVGFNESCFLNGSDQPFPLEEGKYLPLRHDLFLQDAVVLKNTSKTVTLETPLDRRAVTVEFPGMPYIGFWQVAGKNARYLCIEPWCSLPASERGVTVMERQKDLICLPAKSAYENNWRITFQF